MKIYVNEKKININQLNEYIKQISNYKLIYSDDGIFKILKDNIYKINIIDKPITSCYIDGYHLLIDNSIITYDKDITTIPLKHKMINITEICCKLSRELSIKILYENNSLIDYYFETKIIDNNIKNTLIENIKIFN